MDGILTELLELTEASDGAQNTKLIILVVESEATCTPGSCVGLARATKVVLERRRGISRS